MKKLSPTTSSLITPLIFIFSLLISTFVKADDAGWTDNWFDDTDEFMIQTSLFTKHWTPKPEHNNRQELIGFELQKESNWVFGGAFFKNSFGQDTQFLYAGYKWMIPQMDDTFYFKLAGGPMHGYKGQYKDKIPLNQAGVAPAVLPAIGFQYKRVQSELILFGAAGIMITMGFTLPNGN
jgi:hypothetical protein